MIRVPIGPRRKKNCEICGGLIETIEYGYQSAGTPGFTYSFPYPQIVHLEHANTYHKTSPIPGMPPETKGSRPEILKEICEACMEDFGKAVEQFFPDWVTPEPMPTYNDYLLWLQQQGR